MYNGLNDELENVQKRAARLLTRNFSRETWIMTSILEELKWETRNGGRIIVSYYCTKV